MNTQEIKDYIDNAILAKFKDVTSESGEVMTSEGGDGRFFGKVFATRYTGFPKEGDLFLAIGESKTKVQIVKLGRAECLKPGQHDLNLMLEKELGIENKG